MEQVYFKIFYKRSSKQIGENFWRCIFLKSPKISFIIELHSQLWLPFKKICFVTLWISPLKDYPDIQTSDFIYFFCIFSSKWENVEYKGNQCQHWILFKKVTHDRRFPLEIDRNGDKLESQRKWSALDKFSF